MRATAYIKQDKLRCKLCSVNVHLRIHYFYKLAIGHLYAHWLTMWPAVQLLFFTVFLNVSAASGQEQSDAGELSGTGRTQYND